MAAIKATQESIQEHNIGLILRFIKEDKNITRAGLSAKTRLSKSTVSGLVDILIKKNIIREGKKIDSRRGKKPIPLKFNGDYCYILVIDIHIDFITVAIADLFGEIIYRIKKKNQPKNDRAKILENIFNIIGEVLKNSGIGLERIYLFSIGTHGVVNPGTKILSLSPYFPELSGINFVEVFQKKYKKEILLENSVNLGVVGEHWKHFTGIDNLVYIFIHYGIAAGIIINNELVTGSNGTMGEIAHMPLFREYNPQKIQAAKPGLGLFESQVDITGITNMVKKELKSQKSGGSLFDGKNIDKIDFDDICIYYNAPAGNNPVKKIIDDDIVAILSRGIATIIAVIDTNTIIINGKIICLGETFIRKLTDEIYSITPFKPEIVVSGLKEDAPILGAVKFGMNYMDDLLYHRFFSL